MTQERKSTLVTRLALVAALGGGLLLATNHESKSSMPQMTNDILRCRTQVYSEGERDYNLLIIDKMDGSVKFMYGQTNKNGQVEYFSAKDMNLKQTNTDYNALEKRVDIIF